MSLYIVCIIVRESGIKVKIFVCNILFFHLFSVCIVFPLKFNSASHPLASVQVTNTQCRFESGCLVTIEP